MVEQFATYAADPTFRRSILPRAPNAGAQRREVTGSQELETSFPKSMWLHSRGVPNTMNGIFAEVQLSREFAHRPMRRSVFRFAARRLQYPRREFSRDHCGLLAWMPDRDETVDT
jgi:hypothetical protein